MLRKDIEQLMKSIGLKQIDLVINEYDHLAIYCSLKGGTLKDYTDHVIDRKTNIWGCLLWKNGLAVKVPFEEVDHIVECFRKQLVNMFA